MGKLEVTDPGSAKVTGERKLEMLTGALEVTANVVEFNDNTAAGELLIRHSDWNRAIRIDLEPVRVSDLESALYHAAGRWLDQYAAPESERSMIEGAANKRWAAHISAGGVAGRSEVSDMAATKTAKKTAKKKTAAAKKTTKKAAKKRASKAEAAAQRPEQEDLIDVDDPEDKELIAAAKKYEKSKNIRVAASVDEVRDKTIVIDMMKARGKTRYKRRGLIIEVTNPDPGVKVKHEDDD